MGRFYLVIIFFTNLLLSVNILGMLILYFMWIPIHHVVVTLL